MKMKKKKKIKKHKQQEQNNNNQTKNKTLLPLKYVEKWIGQRIQMATYCHKCQLFLYPHVFPAQQNKNEKEKKIKKHKQQTQNNNNQTKNKTLSPLKYVEKWIGQRIQMASYCH